MRLSLKRALTEQFPGNLSEGICQLCEDGLQSRKRIVEDPEKNPVTLATTFTGLSPKRLLALIDDNAPIEDNEKFWRIEERIAQVCNILPGAVELKLKLEEEISRQIKQVRKTQLMTS